MLSASLFLVLAGLWLVGIGNDGRQDEAILVNGIEEKDRNKVIPLDLSDRRDNY